MTPWVVILTPAPTDRGGTICVVCDVMDGATTLTLGIFLLSVIPSYVHGKS